METFVARGARLWRRRADGANTSLPRRRGGPRTGSSGGSNTIHLGIGGVFSFFQQLVSATPTRWCGAHCSRSSAALPRITASASRTGSSSSRPIMRDKRMARRSGAAVQLSHERHRHARQRQSAAGSRAHLSRGGGGASPRLGADILRFATRAHLSQVVLDAHLASARPRARQAS